MMKRRIFKNLALIGWINVWLTAPLPGQEAESSLQSRSGFFDRNKDGRNDWFADANGDGVNDVDGRSYPHAFKFLDQNNDGINDLWSDVDGDGVNDLLGESQKKQNPWIDRDGDGIQDPERPLRGNALKAHVLDADRDGKNDVTGEKYSGSDLGGYRYGAVSEETGVFDNRFHDADGDGMNDRFGQAMGQGNRMMDQFIDQDGNGTADDRDLGQLRGKGKGKGR